MWSIYTLCMMETCARFSEVKKVNKTQLTNTESSIHIDSKIRISQVVLRQVWRKNSKARQSAGDSLPGMRTAFKYRNGPLFKCNWDQHIATRNISSLANQKERQRLRIHPTALGPFWNWYPFFTISINIIYLQFIYHTCAMTRKMPFPHMSLWVFEETHRKNNEKKNATVTSTSCNCSSESPSLVSTMGIKRPPIFGFTGRIRKVESWMSVVFEL